MGEVNCRTGESLEASLNACPNNFRAGERKKKKPLLYHLLDFFPFNAIINRYVTPHSPSTLVEVRTNRFWALWNYMAGWGEGCGAGGRRYLSFCLLWSSVILPSRWILGCGLGNKPQWPGFAAAAFLSAKRASMAILWAQAVRSCPTAGVSYSNWLLLL